MLINAHFFLQGNHQSELIEHRISSIKVTALSKNYHNYSSVLWSLNLGRSAK